MKKGTNPAACLSSPFIILQVFLGNFQSAFFKSGITLLAYVGLLAADFFFIENLYA